MSGEGHQSLEPPGNRQVNLTVCRFRLAVFLLSYFYTIQLVVSCLIPSVPLAELVYHFLIALFGHLAGQILFPNVTIRIR